MKTYTTKQAAELLGTHYKSIQRHLLKLEVKKSGRDYLIDDDVLEQLRKVVRPSSGNPNFTAKAD